jgi:NHLM bacteriocin system ABC transporter ATP-binding protein
MPSWSRTVRDVPIARGDAMSVLAGSGPAPAPQVLDGGSVLWLDDPACAWRVQRGQVQVFAVDRVDGRPTGRYRPLLKIGEGNALMAAPHGSTLALVAAGLEFETTVVPIASGPGPSVGGWLTALVLALEVPASEQGELLERAGACGEPGASATEIEAMQAELFAGLEKRLAAADADVVRSQQRREDRERDLRVNAYTGLGALLGAKRERELAAAPHEDPLLTAIELVVGALGSVVVSPARVSGQSEPERIEAIARASGIRACRARLTATWWREDCGPILGSRRDDGRPVALLPRRPGVYDLVDATAGVPVRVDAELAATLSEQATVFYRPLPDGKLTGRDVFRYVLGGAVRGDLGRLCVYSVAAALLSLAAPLATEFIFSTIVPNQERGNLIWITILLAAVAFVGMTFAIVQELSLLRLDGRVTGGLQAALWDRLLDLPTDFYRRFSPGDLTMRVMGIDEIGKAATTAVATAVVAIPIGAANLILAFVLSPALGLFASVAIVATLAAVIALVRFQTVRERRRQEAQRHLFQAAIEIVEAIGKLRVANATDRAFVRWAARLGEVKRAFYEAQVGFVRLTALLSAATAFATALMFIGAATIGPHALSSATFLAFNAAFLQALAAATGLSAVGTFLALAVPFFDSAAPILTTDRETSSLGGESLALRGAIELSHVSMRYGENEPLVLRDVSLKVDPGELIAIVGPSGSGKSSIMRVLLGFETPEVGSVQFDGHDLAALDARGLRRQMGVVMQTSGLLTGDILMNIVGARDLTVEDAWDAARVAGVERYIRTLPMGLYTIVGEGASSFSGGQRQRLLIARAVAGRPKILLFDEATSALDNQTQAEVADAIANLRATRIVIAHRLSTVRHADRIVVVDAGQIVQVGAFEALMAVDGPFKQLAGRQLL